MVQSADVFLRLVLQLCSLHGKPTCWAGAGGLTGWNSGIGGRCYVSQQNKKFADVLVDLRPELLHHNQTL